jgi:CBS domain-containing protein
MMASTVRELMTSEVVYLQVDTTLDEAARVMRDGGIGDVVVVEDDRLVGLVTDRDIVVRAVAEGYSPTEMTLGAVVSRELVTVQPDDTLRTAATIMREQAVRRVLVCDGERGLVGILSVGDLAIDIDPDSVLGGISGAKPNS